MKRADTLRENMELGFDPKDHTEAEVLQVVADAKRVVECGTALAAKVKAAGGGKKVEADEEAMVKAAEKGDKVAVRRQLEAGVDVEGRRRRIHCAHVGGSERPPSDRQAAARQGRRREREG